MKRVHPLLLSAKRSAEAYCIKPGPYGQHYIWRFRDWDADQPGWRITAKASSREAARAEVLDRLGLAEPVVTITFQPMDQMFDWSWG